MKKKILMVSEASFCQSGYGVYTKEALTRLHKNPNLEVAELACNVEHGDPMLESTPWKCFPNRPKRGDVEGNKQFDVNPYNRFGFFELNRVLMNFQPDFVMDIRDHWHMTFEESSPFRDFFKLAWMPTVDAEPQNQLWINSYEDADALFTYTEFGRDTLFNQSISIRHKFFGVPSPGASDNFKKLEKSTIREKMEIPKDSVVFGTVMRNQRRKLFPDLFAAFRIFLDKLTDVEKERAFLYCHTCHPDVGWDIPELLKEYNLGNNTFFSYQCISCKEVVPKRYNDWCTQCEKCSNFTTHMVGPNNPMEEVMLNDVYNAFDVYVQWATCSPPGEKIWCNDKWTNIEDIKIGDKVLTHTGKTQSVVKTLTNRVKEDLLEISVYGDYRKIKITADHPLYAVSNKATGSRSTRIVIGDSLRNNERKLVNPEFIPAGNLLEGDLLPIPIDYTEQEAIISFNNVSHYVDNDMAKWIGLYVADGSSNLSNNTGSVIITCHAENDQANIKLCEKVMTRFGNIGKYDYKNRNATTRRVCNKAFANYMREVCGKLETKRFPEWIRTLPIEKQKLALQGLCMGDGHYHKKNNVTILCTISESLADQVKHLCKRIGLVYNVRKVIKDGNRKPQYRFEMPGNLKSGEFDVERSNSRGLIHNGYYYSQIKSIEKIPYDGDVYTLEVENDHSYVGTFQTLKNCEGYGISQTEAAHVGLPVVSVNYSGMASVVDNLKGIPITPISYYKELETGCKRAVPNNEVLANVMELLFKDEKLRKDIGQECYINAKKRYIWDDNIKVWEDYFVNTEVPSHQFTWKSPPRFFNPPKEMPEVIKTLTTIEKVNWLFANVLGRPDMIGRAIWKRMTRDLMYGLGLSHFIPGFYFVDASYMCDFERKPMGYSLEDAFKECLAIRNFWNHYEKQRELINCQK